MKNTITKSQKADLKVDNYTNFLELLFLKYGDKPFNYKEAFPIVSEMKISFAYTTCAVKAGILERLDKGTYKFIKVPTKAIGRKLYLKTLSLSKKANRRRSKLVDPISVVKLVSEKKVKLPTTSTRNDNAIRDAINVLKNAGYKIMKPISEYVEI